MHRIAERGLTPQGGTRSQVNTSVNAAAGGIDAFLGSFPVTRQELQGLIVTGHRLIVRYSGSRVLLQIPVLPGAAATELADVELYLEDAMPSRWGLRRIVPENDESPR